MGRAATGDANAQRVIEGKAKPDDALIWNAFMALRTGTGTGFAGVEPIAVSEILAYCELRGIKCPDTRERIRSGVQAMDAELRSHHGTS